MDLPSLFAVVDDSKLDVDWAQAHELLRTLDQDAAWVAHACSQGPGAEITSILRQALEPQLHVSEVVVISKKQRSAHLWALSTMPESTAPADSAGELPRYHLPIARNLIASVTLYEMYHPGPAGRLAGMVDAFATTLDVDEHLSGIEETVEALVDDDEPTAVMWLRTFARMPRTKQWPIAWMIRASMPTVGYQPEAAS